MGTPTNKRVKKSRDAKKAKGYKQIAVWLNEDSIKRIERLTKLLNQIYGGPISNAGIIESALLFYETLLDQDVKSVMAEYCKAEITKGKSLAEIANDLNTQGNIPLAGHTLWDEDTLKATIKEVKRRQRHHKEHRIKALE